MNKTQELWSPNTQTQVLRALLLPPSCCNMVREVSLIWGGSRDNQRAAGGKKGWREWGGWGVLHSNCIAQVGWRCLRSALSFKEGKLMFFFPKHNIVREVHNGKLLPVFPCVCHKLENTQVDSTLVAWTTDYLIQTTVCMYIELCVWMSDTHRNTRNCAFLFLFHHIWLPLQADWFIDRSVQGY